MLTLSRLLMQLLRVRLTNSPSTLNKKASTAVEAFFCFFCFRTVRRDAKCGEIFCLGNFWFVPTHYAILVNRDLLFDCDAKNGC